MNTKVKHHLEEVEVECVAKADGYDGNKVIKAGLKFMFKGVLKNGKFPLWCSPEKKYVSEFSKLTDSEKEKYITRKVLVEDNSKEVLELKKKVLELSEANEALMNENEELHFKVKELSKPKVKNKKVEAKKAEAKKDDVLNLV